MGLVVAAGVRAELALDPQVFDEGRQLVGQCSRQGLGGWWRLGGDLAGVPATRQLGQTQLQQAAKLA